MPEVLVPMHKCNGATGPVIFHDYFAIRGGGERLALTLAEALEASLVFGYSTQDSYPRSMFPRQVLDLRLARQLRTPGVRPSALAVSFSLQQSLAAAYPVRVFSGVAAPFAAPPPAAGGLNIYYCHTPPRFLFDQRKRLLDGMSRARRAASIPILNMFEMAFRRVLRRMDVILANSRNTQNRLKDYLQLESQIIHPPVDLSLFRWRTQGNYYLSTGRLSELKRVDLIIEAFRQMPDKTLIVASGGSEIEALIKRAEGLANVHFTGWIDEAKLQQLVGGAIATIYVPRDEDFGMSPLESMSAGKPVIGVAEGGLLETIEPGATGVLLNPDFTPRELAEAVRAMTPERAMGMRDACERQASLFSKERFVSEILGVTSAMR